MSTFNISQQFSTDGLLINTFVNQKNRCPVKDRYLSVADLCDGYRMM